MMRRGRPIFLWVPTLLALLAGGIFLATYRPDIPVPVLVAKYATGNSSFVDAAGMRVHYRDEGDGDEVLVLLHGTGGSLHTWDEWVDVLRHDLRVIRLDLPGFGLTGPAPGDDYTIQAYVGYLDAFADALGLETFHLAGNSLGGQIAWNYAAHHPDRVNRLVLIDSAGYPGREVSSASTVIRLARMPLVRNVMLSMTPRSLVEQSLAEVYGDPSRITDTLIDRYFELSRRPGNRRAFIERAADSDLDENASLSDVTQPTLILWGAEDRWIPLGDGHGFAADIENSRLVVYPGIGHLPMEELPGPSARAALSFIGSQP